MFIFLKFDSSVIFSAKSHSKEWLLAEKEKFDSEFDKDKDGILNASEILSWVVPSNE